MTATASLHRKHILNGSKQLRRIVGQVEADGKSFVCGRNERDIAVMSKANGKRFIVSINPAMISFDLKAPIEPLC